MLTVSLLCRIEINIQLWTFNAYVVTHSWYLCFIRLNVKRIDGCDQPNKELCERERGNPMYAPDKYSYSIESAPPIAKWHSPKKLFWLFFPSSSSSSRLRLLLFLKTIALCSMEQTDDAQKTSMNLTIYDIYSKSVGIEFTVI